MLKKIAIFTLLCAMNCNAWAQTGGMTDNQVLSYILTQKEAGMPASTIVQNLLKNGVKPDQIQKVRKLYQQQQNSLGMAQEQTQDMTQNRSRGQVNERPQQQMKDNNMLEGANQYGNYPKQRYSREETIELLKIL